MEKQFKILLITHLTSDNLGDQTIEVCSKRMIQTVMKNLKISEDNYDINSVDAAFVNKQYLASQPQNQHIMAEELIKDSDLIIFGGAPMFNYVYEGFAERTIKTLKIIKKYSKPVIFNAIGIENYNEENEVCRRLKNELNDSCIKMVTTRDNIEALRKYITRPDILIGKVSDSAVFSSVAFKGYTDSVRKNTKKIGFFVIRGGAFKDNKLPFSENDVIDLWKNLEKEFEKRGYACEYLTSGSHADESFLHRLIVEHGVDEKKCVININTPEDIVSRIASYDGMIACRLHPSIISYSLKVPTVGIVWNNKVTSFYDSIGYSNRLFHVKNINYSDIADCLEKSINEGVSHDIDFLMSSYQYLFKCMKSIICPASELSAFSYTELLEHFPLYQKSDLAVKVKTKFSRVYASYIKTSALSRNRAKELSEKNKKYTEIINDYNRLLGNIYEMQHKTGVGTRDTEIAKIIDTVKTQTFPIYYNIGKNAKSLTDNLLPSYEENMGEVVVKPRSIEWIPANHNIINDGSACFENNIFQIEGFCFNGWRLRVGIGSEAYLLLENGTWVQRNQYDEKVHGRYKVFQPGDSFPIVFLHGITNFVAEGDWVLPPKKTLSFFSKRIFRD